MVDVALRVLAWFFFVACVVEVFAAPFWVGKEREPRTPLEATVHAVFHALLALVLWDSLR